MWCRYLQPSPWSGLGFTSSHLCAIVRPLDLKCLAFSVPADGATHALASAARTPLAHRAWLRKSSFYRLSAKKKKQDLKMSSVESEEEDAHLVAMAAILLLLLFSNVEVRRILTPRKNTFRLRGIYSHPRALGWW